MKKILPYLLGLVVAVAIYALLLAVKVLIIKALW